MHPVAHPLRGLRAAAIAAVCVTSSLALHVAVGGAVPPVAGCLGTWAVVALLTFALSGRRWTFGRLLVVLGAGQLALHPLFEATSVGGSDAGYAPSAMAVAHLVSTLVLAASLAHGERALWRLAEAIETLLRPLLVLVDVADLGPECWRPVPVVVETAASAGRAEVPRAERAPPLPCSS